MLVKDLQDLPSVCWLYKPSEVLTSSFKKAFLSTHTRTNPGMEVQFRGAQGERGSLTPEHRCP